MLKGIIFDVDGTLLDSMGIWQDVGVRYLEKQGVKPEPGLSEILFPLGIEEGAVYLKEHYHLEQSVDQMIAGVLDTVRDFYYNEVQLKPGVTDYLASLYQKGISMVVATSSERELVEAAFRRLNITNYIEKIFTCSEVGAGKNRPVIYQKASEYLEAGPEEICVFEDVLHALETAKRAGFHTVGVYDRFSADDNEKIQETAELYLEDMTEVDRFWKYASGI